MMDLAIDSYLGGMPVQDVRLLAVEDEAMHGEILTKMLSTLGFKDIVQAENGKMALDVLRKPNQRVHLVLSDIDMPEQNGISMLREIRAATDPAIAQVPVILLTCNRDAQHVLAAKKAGTSHFIGKPFEIATLREKIVGVFAEMRPAVQWQTGVRTPQNAGK